MLSNLIARPLAVLTLALTFLGLNGINAASPSLSTVNATEWRLSNGNSFNMTINSLGYTHSMKWYDRELVGNATGGYSDTGGKITFNFTSGPTIYSKTDEMIHVYFGSYYATVHYILFSDLVGHYQYVVNNNLGIQGEVRSLYRFDPLQFTHGRTNIKDAQLPSIVDIELGYKVEDETWQRPNGTYITKYDFSCFVRGLDYHGVYGYPNKSIGGVGAWIIAPSKDYYIGDHLKQELMLHRESKTDDVVLLNMYHGSHYNSEFSNNIPAGKVWGPWLLYINNGSLTDASSRASLENSSWPYSWYNDTNYHNRGSVSGTLVLSDGRKGSGAAVFLGDENGWETNNQGTNYQYTTYANDDGYFKFDNVRREKGYRLLAWANGGKLSDVDIIHNGTMVNFNSTNVALGTINWMVPKREIIWRIGDFDKKALGFKYAGLPLEHGLSDRTPANLVYAIGTNNESDWYFAQSAQGNWTVIFPQINSTDLNKTATLTLSFAGYTSQNGYGLGADSYAYPEITPTGLNVSMNQVIVPDGFISSENATDGALYRSANVAGGYYATRLNVPAQMFLTDKA